MPEITFLKLLMIEELRQTSKQMITIQHNLHNNKGIFESVTWAEEKEMSMIWMQSSLGKMLQSIPANAIILHTRIFLQTFIKVFQLWFRGRSWSNNVGYSLLECDFFFLFSGQLKNNGVNVLAIEPGTHILEWVKTIQSNLLQNEANKIFLPRNDGRVLNRIILWW